MDPMVLEELGEVARKMRAGARHSYFDGLLTPANQAYLLSCRRLIHGTVLIFTRDTGHHTSGWFKNPDYERCEHLSVSAVPSELWTPDTRDLDAELERAWLNAFFGENVRLLWHEGSHSDAGRSRNVRHWRLFCDERWKPILPRGEVYGTEFTEKGWRSASEMGVEIVSTLNP